MCQVLLVAKVFQEIRVLLVLQVLVVLPSLVLQDPKVPKDLKDLQVDVDLQVNLDWTVKLQSQGLVEILVLLAQMERQGILVLWGLRVQTLHFVGMMGTMVIQDAWGQKERRGVQGFKDYQAYLETQE